MGSIEVGHLSFSPVLQRTPLSTEAMFLMMKRVFEDWGYRRYEWKCDSLNAPSIAAARRLGFVGAGTARVQLRVVSRPAAKVKSRSKRSRRSGRTRVASKSLSQWWADLTR